MYKMDAKLTQKALFTNNFIITKLGVRMKVLFQRDFQAGIDELKKQKVDGVREVEFETSLCKGFKQHNGTEKKSPKPVRQSDQL